MLGKKDLHMRIQLEKSYQNDELFFLGFQKVLKMQASVIERVIMNKRGPYDIGQPLGPY